MENSAPCFLILEDGEIIKGQSFGAKIPKNGEVGKFTCIRIVFSIPFRNIIVYMFFSKYPGMTISRYYC